MERAPWICPACGVGCAPHVDFCGACAFKAAMKPLEEAMKYTPPPPVTPIPWSPGLPTTRTITVTGATAEPCAIADYFRAHPDATSVNMVCYCPRCTPRCVSIPSVWLADPPQTASKITVTLTSTASLADIASGIANHTGTWITTNGAALPAARGLS